jgi:hypothetical protein
MLGCSNSDVRAALQQRDRARIRRPSPDWTTASDARRPSDKLSLLVKAAARLAAEQARQEPELAGAMFETAQWALSSKAADSLAQMAARQAKGDSALAGIVRERQDLVGEWQARDKLLVAAIAQSPDQRNVISGAARSYSEDRRPHR